MRTALSKKQKEILLPVQVFETDATKEELKEELENWLLATKSQKHRNAQNFCGI
ncbi:MAG: hypothetical protein AB1546_01955 [bacterium]